MAIEFSHSSYDLVYRLYTTLLVSIFAAKFYISRNQIS